MIRPPWLPALSAAFVLVVLATIWTIFAPLQFGGQTTYVLVSGASMEPTLYRGDLVLLRQELNYEVGQVVTYRHPEIGPVIHRIVGREGPRYIFQGDNNGWVDGYQPQREELIGALWLHLPGVGKGIEWLRLPRHLAMLVFVMGMIIMTTTLQDERPSPRNRRAAPRRYPAPLQGWVVENRNDLIFLLATLALGALVLALFAFTRPVTRLVPQETLYQHMGQFGYTAAAAEGVYDGATVQTGEPIARRLATSVTVTFDYQLSAEVPVQAAGSYRLLAEISDPSGWKRTVELQPRTDFAQGKFSARGEVNLQQLQQLITQFEAATAVARQHYTLTIRPEVTVQGRLADQPLQEQFAPRLIFLMDPLLVQLAPSEAGKPELLRPTQQGLILSQQSEPNRLAILAFRPPVSTVRWLSLLLLGLALAGLATILRPSPGVRQGDGLAQIAARYGPLTLDVCASGFLTRADRVEVADLSALARVAERTEQLILHEFANERHHYWVHDGATLFHYELADARLLPPGD